MTVLLYCPLFPGLRPGVDDCITVLSLVSRVKAGSG